MCLGVPGKIVETYELNGLLMGKIDFGGVMRETCLAYIQDPQIGQYVIVHVGFAISTLDEDEALHTLEVLRGMGDLSEELGLDRVQ